VSSEGLGDFSPSLPDTDQGDLHGTPFTGSANQSTPEFK
jgi:hypothetical protein